MRKERVIHSDQGILVTEKPSGKKVANFAEELARDFPELKNLSRNGLAHRLDKETSGILLFGRNEDSLKLLKKRFKSREVKKEYLCLVWKEMKKEGKVVTSMKRSPADRRKHASYPPIKEGREAKTDFEVIETFKEYTFLKAKPKTGRRHQLRSQLAYLGHPIAGDSLYGFKDQVDPDGLDRLFLHASTLEVELKKYRRFRSSLPEKLKKIKMKLRCQKS